MTKVFFVGAGPGDPDLITVKGLKIVRSADIIIYAGSLVPRKVIEGHKPGADIYNSASMTLDEVIGVMKEAKSKLIARVHTGDPSIYGAHREQMDRLEALGIEYEVVPGVSSFTASAAALKKEFTLPGVSQTVICTRISGRTDVPDQEDLEKLASHGASMAIFLSVHKIHEVVDKLVRHYSKDTPVAVVSKASWPEEKIVRGYLYNIASLVEAAQITKTAQILVGDFLGSEYELSKLYDPSFSHGYREKKV